MGGLLEEGFHDAAQVLLLGRAAVGVARPVAELRGDHVQLRPGDGVGVGGQVFEREVEVVAAGHNGGAGGNAAQARGQVASGGHVVGQPGVEHGDQIAGVMAPVVGQPLALHMLLHRLCQRAEKRLAGGPTGVDQGEAAQPLLRRPAETGPSPVAISREGLAQAEAKQAVVGGGAGGAADAADPLHLIGMVDGPLVGLLGTHRPAVDQGEPFDAEHLGQQSPLGGHVVAVAHHPALFGQAHGAVAGAAGGAVAEHASNHDAPALRIQHRPRQPGQILGPGPVGGGHQDQVGALGVELTDLEVGELGLRQGVAAGQGKVAELVLAEAHAGKPRAGSLASSWR